MAELEPLTETEHVPLALAERQPIRRQSFSSYIFSTFVGGGAVSAFRWLLTYSGKYSRACKRRLQRDKPLSGLFPKPPARPPLARTITDGPQVPLECFIDALGLDIVVYSWPAPSRAATKGVILMCHGLDGYCEADLAKRPGLSEGKGYSGSWLEALNNAGYLIYSFDYQGMGYSESVVDGLATMCFDYDDYVDEASALYRLLKDRHPQLPFAIFGGSMGGCVALRTAQRMPSAFSACVVWCPAVGNFEKLKGKPENRIVLPLLGVLSRYFPWLPVGKKHTNVMSRATTEEFKIGLPRFNRRTNMRASYCTTALRAGEDAIRDAPKLTMPLWVCHAEDDEMTDFAGSVALIGAATSTNDKMLVTEGLAGADHNIVEADCDPERHQLKYVKMIIAWLDARL